MSQRKPEVEDTSKVPDPPDGEEGAPSGVSRRDLLRLGGSAVIGVAIGCGGGGASPDAGLDADRDAADGGDGGPGDADTTDADLPGDDADLPGDDADLDADLDEPSDAEVDADEPDDADIDADGDRDEDVGPVGPGPLVLLHLTDTHVGDSALPGIALGHGVTEVIPTVAPALTLISGDLVEEGYEDWMWDEYEALISGLAREQLMETPGNHDTHFDTSLTRYLDRSLTGRTTGTSFGHRVIESAGRRLRIVGVNTASSNGRLRNLTGFLQERQVDELIASIDADPAEVDDTIIVGHHPMVGINGLNLLGTDRHLRRLIDHTRAAAYLFGHIHLAAISWIDDVLHIQGPTLGKPSMITEAGYFVIGYDEHGLSARRVGLDVRGESVSTPWPVVLITEPVDSSLGGTNPVAPSLMSGTSGNLLRACVFSPDGPDDVSFRVNGGEWTLMEPRSSWYEAEFDTDLGATMTIEVRALARGQSDSHRIRVRLE